LILPSEKGKSLESSSPISSPQKEPSYRGGEKERKSSIPAIEGARAFLLSEYTHFLPSKKKGRLFSSSSGRGERRKGEGSSFPNKRDAQSLFGEKKKGKGGSEIYQFILFVGEEGKGYPFDEVSEEKKQCLFPLHP